GDECGEVTRIVGVGMRREPALRSQVTAKARDPLERRRGHTRSACGEYGQRFCDEIPHPGEELGAHSGMKAVAIGATEREQTDGALLTQRHERHRAHVVSFLAEQELALR